MRIIDKLQNKHPILVVEFKPDDPNLLNSVKKVKPYVDTIRLTALRNATDPNEPTKTAEQICFESAINVTQKTGLDVMASLTCRDHPRDDGKILASLKRGGVRNLLAVYGDRNDPPYRNRYEFTTSPELIRWVRKQESMDGSEKFCIAVAIDPTSKDISKQVTSLREKREAGADLGITQPIFQPDQTIEWLKAYDAAEEKIPVLIGLLVPKSDKSIAFLEKRLTVNVPSSVKERLKASSPGEGLKVVREVYRALWNDVAGFYIYQWADPELTIVTGLLQELKRQNTS